MATHDAIGDGSWIVTFKAPKDILPDFKETWDLHPPERETITLFGKTHEVPRWHRAYLRDYSFSGKNHKTFEETPEPFQKVLKFFQESVSEKLNGILVNWYEPLDHIGMHSDDETDLKKGEPIITLVLMEDPQATRTFRLVPKGEGIQKNYELGHGDVLIMGGNTQSTHKHGVPVRKRNTSKRISITFRCF